MRRQSSHTWRKNAVLVDQARNQYTTINWEIIDHTMMGHFIQINVDKEFDFATSILDIIWKSRIILLAWIKILFIKNFLKEE
jgi:hypothetical protein